MISFYTCNQAPTLATRQLHFPRKILWRCMPRCKVSTLLPYFFSCSPNHDDLLLGPLLASFVNVHVPHPFLSPLVCLSPLLLQTVPSLLLPHFKLCPNVYVDLHKANRTPFYETSQ